MDLKLFIWNLGNFIFFTDFFNLGDPKFIVPILFLFLNNYDRITIVYFKLLIQK